MTTLEDIDAILLAARAPEGDLVTAAELGDRVVEDWVLSESRLKRRVEDGLAEEVAALRQKLPHELLGGEERYDPGDPQYLSGLMEDIKELLMHRLLTTGSA